MFIFYKEKYCIVSDHPASTHGATDHVQQLRKNIFFPERSRKTSFSTMPYVPYLFSYIADLCCCSVKGTVFLQCALSSGKSPAGYHHGLLFSGYPGAGFAYPSYTCYFSGQLPVGGLSILLSATGDKKYRDFYTS